MQEAFDSMLSWITFVYLLLCQWNNRDFSSYKEKKKQKRRYVNMEYNNAKEKLVTELYITRKQNKSERSRRSD